jgi:predicted ATPase
LDIPLPQERVSTLPPEELRRRQLAAVTAWAIAGASVQPVVLVLEDVHWADPTTLDVARGIAERGALRACSFSSVLDPSSVRLGVRAPITA